MLTRIKQRCAYGLLLFLLLVLLSWTQNRDASAAGTHTHCQEHA
jgi:hypothetical protein